MQALADTCHSLTGCSSLNVMCDLRTCSVYRCGILASKLQQHRIIKELVDRHVFTHTLQRNSCHDCTAYKQLLVSCLLLTHSSLQKQPRILYGSHETNAANLRCSLTICCAASCAQCNPTEWKCFLARMSDESKLAPHPKL